MIPRPRDLQAGAEHILFEDGNEAGVSALLIIERIVKEALQGRCFEE
jgi:hypothetical protein